MRKILVFLSLWLIFSQNAEAEKTHALVILKFPMSAKVIGMGEVGVGISDNGLNNILSNPAGLSLIPHKEFITSYSNFVDTNYGFLGYAKRITTRSVFSVNLATIQSGNMVINYLNGGSKKVKAESDYMLILSNGFMLNKGLSFGINLKAIQSELAEEVKAKSFALDIGALLLASENMNLGVVIQNLGSKVKYKEEKDPLPFNIKVGGGYKFYLNKNEMLLGIDLIKPEDDRIKTHVGIEYAITEEVEDDKIGVYLRTGYEFGYKTKGLTMGIGLRDKKILHLDYAYLPRNDIGDNHYITFGIKFDK
ncbi:MAG: PorV/PorQ family protein [bacterium]|nr:PorV/PorQ family protein [bacterium]